MAAPARSHSAVDLLKSSHQAVVFAGVFIGYIALAQTGFALAGVATIAPPFKPSSGLALAALIAFGASTWPAVFAAALVVALIATGDALLSVATAAGQTLAAIAGSMLIRRFAGGLEVFKSVRTTLQGVFFICVAAIPAALFGGWLGHVTGTLVVAPCALIVLVTGVPRPARDQWPAIAEGAALFTTLAIVGLAVFAGFTPASVKTYSLEFLCLPILLWAAFRFGPREVAVAVTMLASIAVWGTVRGFGPFADHRAGEAAWLLQGYVAVMAITGIAFATALDERRRAEAQLQELATTDPLTGLVNYRRLLDVLRTEMARSRRTGRSFALLLVDMDGLKKINDRHGHLAGSRAICRVADVLRKATRETDVVSRFGGDEFAIVLPESGDEGGLVVMDRVRERLVADSAAPQFSVSGGHAVFPRDGDSPTLLLRAADQRLYSAKHRTSDHAEVPALTAVSA